MNALLTAGFTAAAIVASLEDVNSTLPVKSRVTVNSIYKHRLKHYNAQACANGVWRRMLEEQAEKEGLEETVTSLVTPRVLLQAVMAKGFETITDPDTPVSVAEAMTAARESHRMDLDGSDNLMEMARTRADQNRIHEVVREMIPEDRLDELFARLEGTWPSPLAPTRLRAIEGVSSAPLRASPPRA